MEACNSPLYYLDLWEQDLDHFITGSMHDGSSHAFQILHIQQIPGLRV